MSGGVVDPGGQDDARLEALERALATIAQVLEADGDARERLAQVLAELPAQVELGRKVMAWLGPVLATQSPPLDGAEVATKQYVDDAIARLARALRRDAEAPAPAPRRTKPANRKR